MKKLLIAIAAVLVTAASYGQGQVNFNNRVSASGVNAPVTFAVGGAAAGSAAGLKAELYLVQGAGGTALTPTTTFRSTPAAAQAFLNGITVVVPGVDVGQSATLRVRVYSGDTYQEGVGTWGQSAPVTVTLGGGTGVPADLVGLQAFTLQVVPEPSTIALGALGVAALLFRRRK